MEFIYIGKLVNTHGIKGEVRLLLEVLFCGLAIILLTQGDSTITNEKTNLFWIVDFLCFFRCCYNFVLLDNNKIKINVY